MAFSTPASVARRPDGGEPPIGPAFGPANAAKSAYARLTMPNHLTPEEIAAEHGLEREEVIRFCVEHDVPVFQGRIDKTLFAAEWHVAKSKAAKAEEAD